MHDNRTKSHNEDEAALYRVFRDSFQMKVKLDQKLEYSEGASQEMTLWKSISGRELQQMLWYWVGIKFSEFKDKKKDTVAEV